MIIYGKANPPKVTLEKGGGKSLVETHGYQTAEQRIKNLTNAGIRLQASRRGYDSDEMEALEIDPTRRPGLDMAEATMLDRDVQSRIAEARARDARSQEEARKLAENLKKNATKGAE